jgi:hypothetical protein|tara:strand:- start:488 stop:727 length:240 start_codon:yes stop_codon:yes gene_type:complete
MDSNNLIILLLGVVSLFLIKDYSNKSIGILIFGTILVGMCITNDVLLSISLGLISGSLFTLIFQKRSESFEDYKKRKST